MALVVLLRGVNVGGHRTFSPKALAESLKHLDVVNIGAAGTFVVRRPVTRRQLRAELARQLPFEADAMICDGREILGLVDRGVFVDEAAGPDGVHFVSVLAKRPHSTPPDADLLSAERHLAVETSGSARPVRLRRLPSPDASDPAPWKHRQDLRAACHNAQLEHHSAIGAVLRRKDPRVATS